MNMKGVTKEWRIFNLGNWKGVFLSTEGYLYHWNHQMAEHAPSLSRVLSTVWPTLLIISPLLKLPVTVLIIDNSGEMLSKCLRSFAILNEKPNCFSLKYNCIGRYTNKYINLPELIKLNTWIGKTELSDSLRINKEFPLWALHKSANS